MYGEFAARTVRSFVAIALATVLAGALAVSRAQGQEVRNPSSELAALHDIVADVSADRVEADIRRLAGFGTRHTLSDTLSETRGIGAARRWIKARFDEISAACGGCLDVSYQTSLSHATASTGRSSTWGCRVRNRACSAGGIWPRWRWRRASPVVFPWPIGAYEPLEWLERDP